MARMIDLAVSSSVPLSVLTVTLPLPDRVASPMMVVTLFFLNRCPMPPDSCLATPRDRFTTAGRS
ncbi:hypothetical protein MGSAQ_001023 [marine sediment metagenome]|uniref:Uncharacterized protein n=1 Tax=marine sediment metagenome TaxID=412755 RepID=A0A1B6NVW8_9ZZZZ